MGEPQGFEGQLEHYLQGHFHPDVAPQVRREIQLGTISIEGFMRLADIFKANHEALDDGLIAQVESLDNVIRAEFGRSNTSA